MATNPTVDPVHEARARVAIACRNHNLDAATKARRDLTAAVLARRIREALDAQPAMTSDHRAYLTRLLNGDAE
jgi:hypothetical protein